MISPNQSPVLSARNFSKTFSGRTVLRNVDLELMPGEVHGLVGQNGSGKSTFIKILAGYHTPDEGATLTVCGRHVALPLDPSKPHVLGLSFVHQDLGLVPEASVLENLRVGSYETGFGWRIRWRQERQYVRDSLRRFGLGHISVDANVGSLREVERAMIAIIRAFDRLKGFTQGVLVLDEPTAYLPRDGVERLFDAVREAAAGGMGVLFVTHRLEEVREFTDRVTILRDGVRIETAQTNSLSERDLIGRILGRSLGELYPTPPKIRGSVALTARNVSSSRAVRPFSFELLSGEIVGLTGLVGMGHEHILHMLFGSQPASSGEISLRGRTYDLREISPRAAIEAGLALLPANRIRDAAAPSATITENVTLPTLSRYYSGGRLRHRRERGAVSALLHEFQVTPSEPNRVFAKLSGGNQQKALVAKWFATRSEIFLLHEPTQGVDIGARKQIFTQIRDLAEAGSAVVIASAEYEDLAHLCDRVFIFRDGSAVTELHGAELTEERIVEQCFVSNPSGPSAVMRADGDEFDREPHEVLPADAKTSGEVGATTVAHATQQEE
jgi:ribose transport system ATP-binding protein